VLVFRDISDMHRQKAELRGSEWQFRQTVMNVSVPTLLHADDDTILLVNEAWTEITGYRIEDIPTLGDWTQKAYGERHATAKKYIDTLFEADTRQDNGEWTVTTASGEKRVWHFSSTPVGLDPNGRRLIVSNAIDITERKRADEVLRDTRERLQAALDGSGAGTFRWNIQTNVLDWDENLDRLFGLPPGRTIRSLENFIATVHPDERAGVIDRCERCACDGADFDMEFRVIWPDGSVHWLDDQGKTVRDTVGKPLYMTGMCLDITERKVAEENLRESEERFRAMADNIPQLAWIADAGTEGQASWFNKVWLDYTGTTIEQMRGSGWKAVHHPDHVEAVAKKFEHHVKEGLDWEDTFPLRDQDGQFRWFLSRMKVIRDEAGAVTRLFGTNTDITQQRQMADELRAAHNTFRHLVDHSPFGIYAVDSDFRLVQVSAGARKAFESVHPLIGRDFGEVMRILWPERFANEAIAIFRRVLETGDTYHAPSMVEARADIGEVEAYDWKAERITLPDGRPGVVCHFYDLSERQRFEARLREQEQRLRSLVENSPLSVVEWNSDFVISRWAGEAEATFGWSAAEVVGRPIPELEMIYEEDRHIVESVVARLNDGATRHLTQSLRLYTKDRQVIQCIWHHSVLVDAEGKMISVLALGEDVTARKEAEAELLIRTMELETVMREAPVSIFVGHGADCSLVTGNPAAHSLLRTGGAPNVAADAPGIPFVVQREGQPVPNAELPVQRAAATGQPVPNSEIEVVFANGEGRVLFGGAVPLFDEAGAVRGSLGTFVDITELKAAERALHESETRIRLATEATAVGIWEWNVLTNAIRWDAQLFRIYGIPPTADGFVQYSDWSGALLPEDLPENERILLDTVRRCGNSRREFRIQRRGDGEQRSIEAVETVRTNDVGVAEWVIGTNLDVTDRKTAENQLRQLAAALSEADRRKDEFLATLAHELRNPLAPIRNGLQLMKLVGGQEATFEEARSMMERQVTQMVRLVDDLMDVSRISQGKLELKKERVQLAAVVKSAVETSQPLIEQLGHELTVMLPDQPVVVDADLTRLAQVFLNLLNNAAKYSDRGGHIMLAVERQGSEVLVSVRDTGIGIPADQMPHIFEMFTQVERSLEKSQGGLGIGLSLVKRLVEMHGGRVEAKSEGLGKGSEFVVRLPVVIEASKPQESGDAEGKPAKSSLRILIVDDNRDSADSLGMMLRIMGNDTRTAYDGQAGVDLAGEFRPEVLLLDIGLPKLNGYEACRRIREQPWGKGIVLIAVTGWGQDDDRRRSHEAGFDHHMVKPLDPQNLMQMLADLQSAKT
jgi:PAS domain S-box-containing protein